MPILKIYNYARSVRLAQTISIILIILLGYRIIYKLRLPNFITRRCILVSFRNVTGKGAHIIDLLDVTFHNVFDRWTGLIFN